MVMMIARWWWRECGSSGDDEGGEVIWCSGEDGGCEAAGGLAGCGAAVVMMLVTVGGWCRRCRLAVVAATGRNFGRRGWCGAGGEREEREERTYPSTPVRSALSNPYIRKVNRPMVPGRCDNELDFDDLYNNLKVYEHELKGVSNSNSQNIAFLSTEVKGSTLKQNLCPQLMMLRPAALMKMYEEIDIRWQVAMITARIRKFMRKTGRSIDLKPKNGITFDKSKIECFNCQKLVEQDDWSMEFDAEHVHFGQDGLGDFDWSNKADDTPVSLALMATNSEVPYCSKCSKSYKKLLESYQTERDNFQKARTEILGYQMSLESLEVILKTHEKNEYAWGDKYEQMEYDLKIRDLKLEEKQKELDQALKERDDFKVKLEKWSNASVLQNEVLNKQRYLSDKTCIGFGVESSSGMESDNSSGNTNSTDSLYPNFQKTKGFHSVPPPTGTIIPPRANVSFTGIDELAIRNKVLNQENTKSSQPEIDRNKVIIEDWVDSDDEETVLNSSDIQKKTVLNSENSETSFENKSPSSQNSVGQGSRKTGLGHKGVDALGSMTETGQAVGFVNEFLCDITFFYVEGDDVVISSHSEGFSPASCHGSLDESLMEDVNILEDDGLLAMHEIIHWVYNITKAEYVACAKLLCLLRNHFVTDLLFDDAHGVDCFPKQVIWDLLRDIGYEGNLAQLTFSKPLFSPQWKYLVHVLLHCLSPKSTSWEQFGTNIASALVGLATNRKFNFSLMIMNGMLGHISNGTPFLMYPRFIQLFLNKQLEGVARPQDFIPSVTLPSKVFTFMRKHSPKFSCRITPLTPPMLEVVTALAAEEAHSTSPHSRAASSARDAQGTPDQSAAQASISQGTAEVQGTDNSQGTADVQGTADFQGTAETQGAADTPKSPNDYTPTDASQTSVGDEGLLDLYALTREVKRLKRQTLSQAKQIIKLKTKLKKLSKMVQPVVQHHTLWVESQKHKKRRKKQKKQKKKVSSVKLGRNKDEGTLSEEHYVQDDYTADPFFEDIVDKDAAVTPDLERKSDETEEINIEEKKASDVKSGDTEELDLEAVQSTARQSTITPRTLNFNDEAGPSSPIRPTQNIEPEEQFKVDEVLADISRPRGLSIPGPIQSQPQPQQPSQATDPKDKGKGILVEEPKKKKLTLQQIRALETTNDEEVARKIQAEWDAEEERKRLEELKKAKPKTTLKKPTSLAQERNHMMNFLKGQGYKNLQKLKYPQMKELYDKVQESKKRSFQRFIQWTQREKSDVKERDEIDS
ncbi:hypothetical protein Tco_0191424 [Tanacetum coccineum]